MELSNRQVIADWERALRLIWLALPDVQSKASKDGIALINARINLISGNKDILEQVTASKDPKEVILCSAGEKAHLEVLSLPPDIASALFKALEEGRQELLTVLDGLLSVDRERIKRNDVVLLGNRYMPDSLPSSSRPPIQIRSFARLGLMGNPSDGFGGKTLSMLLANFWMDVVIVPRLTLDISLDLSPDPILDSLSFPSLRICQDACVKDGYDGIHRLFLATLKVFYAYCMSHGYSNQCETVPGFTLRASTNIPRQVGLSGSSAFITGFLRTLLRHYNIDIPPAILANLALSVEQDELGISAGLQDRVIQTHGGLVYMDFSTKLLKERGFGEYEKMDSKLLPEGLWIGMSHRLHSNIAHSLTRDTAYTTKPKESGKVHNNVRSRYLNGDPIVLEAMATFASFAAEAKQSLLEKDTIKFAGLMKRNFSLRRSLYGDAVIGARNLRMIELAAEYGHAAKFCGSGGCIVGLWAGPSSAVEDRARQTLGLQKALMREGFVFCRVVQVTDLQ